MKKIIASAGLVAVSATGLYGQGTAPADTRMITTKPWTVSAALRGFYDDNIVSGPNNSNLKKDSFGIDLRPSVAVSLRQQDQTTFGASYTYGMKWYESRSGPGEDSIDHSHEANLRLMHAFSPQYKAIVNDSFVYTQEPALLEGVGAAPTTFLRQDLSAIRNRGSVEVSGRFTDLLGAAVGYENGYYDFLGGTTAGGTSLATLLNRLEHTIRLDGQWHARPDLVAILGYQYGRSDYTSDAPLQAGSPLLGSSRSSQSHYAYVGAEYSMSAKLTAKGRAGAVVTTWNTINADAVSPYADISLTYKYLPGDSVQVGVRQQRNATDQYVAFGGVLNQGSLVLDQDSTALYAMLIHKITPRVTGSLLGQYVHSIYNGGGLNDLVDNYVSLGANLAYKISPMFSVETGYNLDRLDSDLGSNLRSFTRNVVYVGVRATY